MSQKIDIDPAHAVALASRVTLADKIRYACEHVETPTTLAVKQWLDAYGVTITRSYATGIINTWRGENRIGDTGDLVAMSPELLAELDALRSTEAATDSAVPADDTPTRADLRPVPENPEPVDNAAGNTTSTATTDNSDTVDTDRVNSVDTADTTPATPEPESARDAETAAPAAKGETAEEWAAALLARAESAAIAAEAPAEEPTADAAPEPAKPPVGNAMVVAEKHNAVEQTAVEPADAVREVRAERVADPLLEPAGPITQAKMPTVLSWSANMAWIVVLVAAMGISWWSLFEYARSFSIPTPLAAVVSLVFDASALIVAGLAHRYALSPYSGAGPRFALLALLAGSVYLNWEHAAGKGYGIEASIMFAAPAAVGILLFELHIGWHSRTERRARGRVARSLPVIGAWGWFLHPLQSLTTLWRVTAARGRSVREAELSSIEQVRAIAS
ncbi:DUF2637 domain-containing protein [Actinokineospora sp. NBRC 105648]|uniref:DUF2637 domain-containing protein n=1 Tax=Actinokineospora sp. NBRC 105648 TaxID=3032206 RepID=UPI0024A18614|nr:DUF2637 domain-containing protein [Actinokineospora sp. NBRC 105648]GLZ41858.1 hypothetical protein Acsp05_54820 [Actinokineospora sp. NBRC 105648]